MQCPTESELGWHLGEQIFSFAFALPAAQQTVNCVTLMLMLPLCPSGDIVTYRWEVPERSGPGPNDSVCVPWIYYSMVDPVKVKYRF